MAPATKRGGTRTARKGVANRAEKMPVSDDAVRAKTGRGWDEWLAILDAAGAAKKPHREIAEYLSLEHNVPPWWTQAVTVGYERARGLRATHQTTRGYQVGASKTVAVPVKKLYAAWADDRARRAWLPDSFTVRKATPAKSMRISWPDGTSVSVYFSAKGDGRSQVTIDHGKLPRAAEVARKRAYWKERLERLKSKLEG